MSRQLASDVKELVNLQHLSLPFCGSSPPTPFNPIQTFVVLPIGQQNTLKWHRQLIQLAGKFGGGNFDEFITIQFWPEKVWQIFYQLAKYICIGWKHLADLVWRNASKISYYVVANKRVAQCLRIVYMQARAGISDRFRESQGCPSLQPQGMQKTLAICINIKVLTKTCQAALPLLIFVTYTMPLHL